MPFNVTLQDASAVTGLAEQLISAQSSYASIENQLASLKSDVSNLQTVINANSDFFDNTNVATQLGLIVTKITNAEGDLL